MENVWRDPSGRLLESDRLWVSVEPGHGMTITEIRVPGRTKNVLWARPRSVPRGRTRSLGPTGARSIDTMHDLLLGGWFEMSPHAGLPGRLDGRMTMLHGEACRLPWTVDVVDRARIDATARCVRYPLRMERQVVVHGATVTVRSVLRNDSARTWTVSHGEHPCFDRPAFAGAVITADVRSARVLEPFERRAASLRSGPFDWPLAKRMDGGAEDVSRIPERPSGAQDHVAVHLASSAVRVEARTGLVATLDVDPARHPYLLLWRSFGAPNSLDHEPWDVFAVEPQSTDGFGVIDANPTDLTVLGPGQAMTTQLALTVTTADREVR